MSRRLNSLDVIIFAELESLGATHHLLGADRLLKAILV